MNEPLRILMLTHHRRFKVRFRSHAMARCLAERGHEVCEVCIADTRRAGIVESEWDGVRLLETPDLLWGRGRSGWDPWDMVNRLAYFNRERQSFDLIHCFETRPVTIYPALAYQRQHAIPIITDWVDWWGRGGIIDELRPRWYRLLFGGLETYYEEAFRTAADGLTVISSALAERARKLGVPDERICHVPGGTFAEEFPRHSREECRRHVGLPESIPILAFSSLDSFLDIEFIMQAFRLVVEKYPNALLLVTGKTPADVAILAERYQVQGNVRLTGFVPFEELSWYLGCADVFVLPFPDRIYNRGRWPNKVGDYMAVGRPIVTNPVGDVKALLERNEIGLLADWSACDFAAKTIELLENHEMAARLGENGHYLATSDYNWRHLALSVEAFYRDILRQKANARK